MKSRSIFIGLFLLISGMGHAQTKDHDFGITAALWLPGEIYLEDYNVYLDQGSSPLIKVFYDYYIVEKFCVGMYGTVSPTNYPDFDETATMYEFGMSFKPRIKVSSELALKPGLNIGYRMYTDIPSTDDMNALGMNLSVEAQLKPRGKWTPHIEAGFLAQPIGGNSSTDATYAPIWYLGAGVSF